MDLQHLLVLCSTVVVLGDVETAVMSRTSGQPFLPVRRPDAEHAT